MKTTVKGIVMEKNKRTSKDGQNTYFSFNIFQKGETDLLVIKCSEQQFAGIKEGETVQWKYQQRLISIHTVTVRSFLAS